MDNRTQLQNRRRPRRLQHGMAVALAAFFAAVLGLALSGVPASAVEDGGTGWVRVGHLSPDTKSVDVQLARVAGGKAVFELDDVAYGDVSDYRSLQEGTYILSMRPAGSAGTTDPLISQSVAIKAGQPITVAALGTNAELETKVIQDDLTAPADDKARVRVLQASTEVESVDITTTQGTVIAKDARSGTVTGYATVGSGPWNLELTSNSATANAKVDLASGSVNTLLVLDNASGGLTVKTLTDSESVDETPVGGVNTGAPVSMAGAGSGGGWLLAGGGLSVVVLLAALTVAPVRTAGSRLLRSAGSGRFRIRQSRSADET